MAIGSRVNEKRRFYAGDVFCQAVFATEQQWAVQYCQSSAGCVPDITCPLAGQDMAQECPRYVLLSGEPQAGEEKVDPTVLRWIQFTDVGGVILSIIFILPQWIAFFCMKCPSTLSNFRPRQKARSRSR